MSRYNPQNVEAKWQKKWLREEIYEPDLKKAKRPFYNLMMFPYPSAEGLHVGNMYAFTGADIYGRLKRMQGFDLFEPIGLDGFGINSENYALKIGKHPAEQAKISEKNFYRQLKIIGNGFAWKEKLETYDPGYYKWTQWIFMQLFKRGLAYRKKAPVNWCSSCKTVLADEQVVGGECERCSTKVVKKELEQWFFKITDYAERLLKNLDEIDWSPKIKIAQKNWIGKNEGILFRFPVKTDESFVLLHGYKGSPERDFFPWLKRMLEIQGLNVYAPQLPNPAEPTIEEQVEFLLKNYEFKRDTVLVTHSLGGVVAMKLLPRLVVKIKKLVMVAPPLRLEFLDGKRREPLERATDWKFDFTAIKKAAEEIVVVQDINDRIVPPSHPEEVAKNLGAELKKVIAPVPHFNCSESADIFNEVVPSIEVFTTRPDTLFGATYMVLAPEHPLVKNYELRIKNYKEIKKYIDNAKNRSEKERIAESREKTGIELKGIKAINPATGEEIPIWVADYVLGQVGTGAIMAVPAHDQRDFEFAQKNSLPIKMVVCPHYPASTCPVLDKAYAGKGHLVDSGKFSGMPSEEAKTKITEFVGGKKKIQYRLRDWLISRQRYWGPPIPLVYCKECGWQPVPEKDLPVKLPHLKNFRPTGTEKSPLALVEKFYKVRCPKCKGWARRETDVSDTFLDSAWYYIGYLAKENSKFEIKNSKFRSRAKRWLPVDMYIGGAEHAVLHLLYVRFLAMALYDLGFLHFEEPFKKFRTHGLIIKDGAKMSKSRGNVVSPDDYIRAYGADALRMYLMFLGPFEQGGDFRDTGIKGITRFLERVWGLIFNFQFSIFKKNSKSQMQKILHQTVKKVTEDIENLQYNTAISALMVLLNKFEENDAEVNKEDIKIFLKLLAPFAPHITEELYQQFFANPKPETRNPKQIRNPKFKITKQFRSIHTEGWPVYNPELIRETTFELVVQINGKVRGKTQLAVGATEVEAKKAAKELGNIKQYLTSEPRKIIFIPDKLINFVV